MRPTEIRQDIKAEVLRQTAKLEKDGGMCAELFWKVGDGIKL